MIIKLLDCFCGKGGVSDGFAKEGFDCIGIDLVDAPGKLGYKHKFIHADFLHLDGQDFKGYDVIWGSPPCRDFSLFAKRFGKTWKRNPPDPQGGLILVNAFLQFVDKAKPKFWIMENVPGLTEHLDIKPLVITSLGNPSKCEMRRAFWGTFPPFLIPKAKRQPMRNRPEVKRKAYNNGGDRAKIPPIVSRSFAIAIKEELNKIANSC